MNRNFKTIFALSMCAVLTIGLSTIASCSADEDYSAFAGDELETLAEGDLRMSSETSGYEIDPNNIWLNDLKRECAGGGCAVWCIGYLMSCKDNISMTNLLRTADGIKSDWKIDGLDGYQIINLAHAMNVQLDSLITYRYLTVSNGDTIIHTNNERVYDKIRFLQNQNRLNPSIVSLGNQHWVIATSQNNSTLSCIDVNCFEIYDYNNNNSDGRTNYQMNQIRELIYR